MKKSLKIAIASTVLASTALFAASNTAVAKPQAPGFSPAQVTDIQKIVHDYLIAHPKVLVEASQALQAQQQQKIESEAMSAIKQNKAAIFNDAQTPSIGAKNAPVTLVEFFDYQCGHCRAMQPTLEKLVKQDHSIRFVFKELPIFGGTSNYAAKAALAVAKIQPGKYYAFHNAMLTSTNGLNPKTIAAIAKKEGVNVAKMKQAMHSKSIEKQIKANFALAQLLKVMGTPTFVIGNKAETKFGYIPGATSQQDLQQQLDAVK